MNIFNKQEIDSSLIRVLDFFNKNIENLSFIKKDKVITQIQFFHDFKFENEIDQIIYKIILDHCFKAEYTSPGCIQLFFEFLKSNFSEQKLLSYFPKSNDIEWIIENFCSEKSKEIIKNSTELVGFNGKFFLEKSLNSKTVVEIVNGYNFENVFVEFKTQTKTVLEPYIICIDGFIETVSEINKLLLQASENKLCILIFARGFHNEVLNTISVNNLRGTFLIFPIKISYDLNGANTLVDISYISNSDVFSSLKGDLITSLSLEDCKKIKSATIYQDKVNLISNVNILNHLNNLRIKRNMSENEYNDKVFEQRIKSLTTKRCNIKIPENINFIQFSQEFDLILRAFKSLITHGTIFYKEKKYLTLSFQVSQIYSKKCMEQINNLGCIISK